MLKYFRHGWAEIIFVVHRRYDSLCVTARTDCRHSLLIDPRSPGHHTLTCPLINTCRPEVAGARVLLPRLVEAHWDCNFVSSVGEDSWAESLWYRDHAESTKITGTTEVRKLWQHHLTWSGDNWVNDKIVIISDSLHGKLSLSHCDLQCTGSCGSVPLQTWQ